MEFQNYQKVGERMVLLKTDEITAPNFENMANEMKKLSQWVMWKIEPKTDGTLSKVPYQINGIKANPKDGNTWSSFDEVKAAYYKGGFTGVGFVFTKESRIVGLDIDDLDVDNLSEDIELLTIGSFTEISVSGRGIHIFVRGRKLEGMGAKKGNYECYDEGRFFAVTGNQINGVKDVLENQNIINEFSRLYLPVEKKHVHKGQTEGIGNNLSDSDIVGLLQRYKPKAMKVYEGNFTDYHSQSEAVLGLMNDLAYYTAKDAAQMESIFMSSSATYDNPKDNNRKMGYAIEKTIRDTRNVYVPKKQTNKVVPFNGFSEQTSSKNLKEILQERRAIEIERAIEEWEEANKKGKKPSTLSTIQCTSILQEYIPFILFDLDENARLAMYQAKEGIYTNNTTLIKRVISWLEPTFNEIKASEVIYHLTNRAEVKERTTSRYLIPVQNGVFNLETKKLEPFSPDYVFTSKIETSYIEGATDPIVDGWDIEDWISSIACGDSEVSLLLWQVINDSLNGNFSRKKAIFLLGQGNNGKGTYQELITNLLGPRNVATLKVDEFDTRFKLSLLEGKTAVIGDDLQANTYIDNSSNFNSVVTGDRVIIEQKNKPIYSTVFRCSVIQSTNGMPKFKNKTGGTIRRLVIVPFNADFNGEVENFKIKDEYIKNEKVLQYVLNKAINMDFEKFDIPTASTIELEEFKQDNDPVVDFKINVFDSWKLHEVPKSIVYAMYKHFCNENGYKPISDRKFHKEFKLHLNSEWVDGFKRFDYEDLINKIGDLDEMGIGFPNKSKPLSSYKNEKLKIV